MLKELRWIEASMNKGFGVRRGNGALDPSCRALCPASRIKPTDFTGERPSSDRDPTNRVSVGRQQTSCQKIPSAYQVFATRWQLRLARKIILPHMSQRGATKSTPHEVLPMERLEMAGG
jgi:hypothetical protein